MLALPGGVGDFGAGTAVAAAAAVCFAVGSVLQHHAATHASGGEGLDVRGLLTHRAWLVGQSATVLGSALQVVALALAPVSIVQPLLAGALVVALAIRAVKDRCVPQRSALVGAACTVGGLAVFLGAARPAPGLPEHLPSVAGTVAAAVVALGLVAGASRLRSGTVGALVCGAIAGIVGGTAAVLIATAIKALGQGGGVRGLGIVAVVAAVLVAVAAQLASQQAYSRGSLAWSLPALTLADPLAAVPVARLLLGERLEPGHAVVWVPAALVAVAGVFLLARSGDSCRRPLRWRFPQARGVGGGIGSG
ncbi:MAG: DMT family transporter [Pseudonocardia sp.]|nr:DMT family transporter [Pseudonocardia sp.]